MYSFPLGELHGCLERYRSDYRVQSFPCLGQFFWLAFALPALLLLRSHDCHRGFWVYILLHSYAR